MECESWGTLEGLAVGDIACDVRSVLSAVLSGLGFLAAPARTAGLEIHEATYCRHREGGILNAKNEREAMRMPILRRTIPEIIRQVCDQRSPIPYKWLNGDCDRALIAAKEIVVFSGS